MTDGPFNPQDITQEQDSSSTGPMFSGMGTTGTDETANTIFDPAGPYAKMHDPQTWQQVVGGALQKTAKSIGSPQSSLAQSGIRQIARYDSINQISSARERVPLEPTKPAQKSGPLRSEDAQATWRRWYNDMRQFGYKETK